MMRPRILLIGLFSLLLLTATPSSAAQKAHGPKRRTPNAHAALARSPTPTPTATVTFTQSPSSTIQLPGAIESSVVLSAELFRKELDRQSAVIEASSRLNKWSTILTLLTLAILLFTALINKRLAIATERMARDTKRYADTSYRQYAASMRPWVTARRHSLRDGTAPHIMAVHWRNLNDGNALARNCVSSIHVIQQTSEGLHSPRIDSQSRNLLIGPHSGAWSMMEVAWGTTEEPGGHWRQLLKQKDASGQPIVILRFAITIRYEGAAGEQYWTYSCTQYDADKDNFMVLVEEEGTEANTTDEAAPESR